MDDGRAELPDHSKRLLRTVEVVVPHCARAACQRAHALPPCARHATRLTPRLPSPCGAAGAILGEARLLASGYLEARSLARKLALAYKLRAEQLSPHYGMSALMAIKLPKPDMHMQEAPRTEEAVRPRTRRRDAAPPHRHHHHRHAAAVSPPHCHAAPPPRHPTTTPRRCCRRLTPARSALAPCGATIAPPHAST